MNEDRIYAGRFEQRALVEILVKFLNCNVDPRKVLVVYCYKNHIAEIWIQRDAEKAWVIIEDQNE